MTSLRAALFLSLVACAHPPRPPEEEEPPDRTSMNPRPLPDAGTDPLPAAPPPVAEPTPPPELAPEVNVPDEPTTGHPVASQLTPRSPLTCDLPPLEPGATRWLARQLSTGTMPGPSHLHTFVLDHVGDQVRWTEFTQRAHKPGPPGPELPPKEWSCAEAVTTTAVVERTTKRELVVNFTVPNERYSMRCERRRLGVAPPDARRQPLRQLDESCKRSRWETEARQQVDALVCVQSAAGSVTIFGAAPGVEHVTMDEDDCGDPTLALRRVGPDGAIRTVRRLPATK